MKNSEDCIKRLGEMIKGIQIAMLTTCDHEGRLRSRPMAAQQIDFDGDLWFFTHLDSPKSDELRRDSRVCLSYMDDDGNCFVSVSGSGEIIQDRKKAEELWNPTYKSWFPDGLEDPQLALLKVKVHAAEYWRSPSGKVIQLFGFVKALATGQEYHPEKNQKLDLAG